MKARTGALVAFFTLISLNLLSYELTFTTSDGYDFPFEVNQNDTIADVRDDLTYLLSVPREEIRLYHKGREVKDFEKPFHHDLDRLAIALDEEQVNFLKSVERNYWSPLTVSDKKDIGFIVKTLAYKPLTKIWKYKGSLEYAGDRIQHLHPFNFLYAIFGSEELKVGVRNIRKRGWVWGDFFAGIKTSFKEETAKGNVTDEQMEDFAKKLEIDVEIIRSLIHGHHWLEFTDFLIENVPRKGDTGRYGM